LPGRASARGDVGGVRAGPVLRPPIDPGAHLARALASSYRSPASPQLPQQFLPIHMPSITYIDYEGTPRTVEGEVGSTVMETAIKNGIPGIEAECGGACACATCHVHVDEAWRAVVGEPSPMEEDMLDFGYDVKPDSRLSCQIKVTAELEGLVVRTPERQA
jgi:ferredoxin, 2Fe-2S